MMLIHAAQSAEASESAFGLLHALVGKMGRDGLMAEEAIGIGLSEAEVEIDTVNTLIPREFFEITSVARTDLEQMGFDASKVSDEHMQSLARKMADDYTGDLFWRSMKKHVDAMGIPLKPPESASNPSTGPE